MYLEHTYGLFREPGTPLSEDAKLLRKRVLAQIEDEPSSFDMRTWESTLDLLGMDGSCHTTRCLAGWATFFADGKVPRSADVITPRAIELLELTMEEYGGKVVNGNPFFATPLFVTWDEDALERMRVLAEAE